MSEEELTALAQRAVKAKADIATLVMQLMSTAPFTVMEGNDCNLGCR